MEQKEKYSNSYLMVLLRVLDIMAASCIWRDYGVTISSMVGIEMRKPQPKWWARWLNTFLNVFQKGHCEKAVTADISRARETLKILQAD